MRRLIIDFEDPISAEDALAHVLAVVSQGRASMPVTRLGDYFWVGPRREKPGQDSDPFVVREGSNDG